MKATEAEVITTIIGCFWIALLAYIGWIIGWIIGAGMALSAIIK